VEGELPTTKDMLRARKEIDQCHREEVGKRIVDITLSSSQVISFR